MNRLSEIRKNKNLTQSAVAKHLGISRQAYSNYELGNREPDFALLNDLANYFNVTVDYLLGRTDLPTYAETPSYANILPLPKTKKVPLLGAIACGEPIFADENIEEYIAMPDQIDADYCLRCQGDSMTGARIMDGDIVFIKQQSTVDNGQIAAVLIDDEATLKRVYYHPGVLSLQAENPKYPPLVYTGEELAQVRILGLAVAFLSRVK